MKSTSLIAVVIGMVLLVGSFTWALLFPPSQNWTAEKDARMSELRMKGHSLGGELDAAQRKPSMHGRSVAEIEAEYKQVKEDMAQLTSEFQSGHDSPKTMASILRWVGVGLLAVGVFVNYIGKA